MGRGRDASLCAWLRTPNASAPVLSNVFEHQDTGERLCSFEHPTERVRGACPYRRDQQDRRHRRLELPGPRGASTLPVHWKTVEGTPRSKLAPPEATARC